MTIATLIPLILSAGALVFSGYVFVDSRNKDHRDIFIKMHELLISDDVARGRYLIFQKLTDESSVEGLSDQEFRDVNRALAAYNLLGVYLKNGYVNERDVIEVWGRTIYRAWIAAQPFLTYREQSQGYVSMPFFKLMAQRVQERLSENGSLPEFVIRRRSSEVE